MRRVFTSIALLGASALFSALLVASPAQAAVHHSNLGAQAKHFEECLKLMVSDPTKHAQVCGPGHEWTGKFSHEGDFSGTNLLPPPPKTEEPCEKPPCEEPPCWHPCWKPCEGGESEVQTFTFGRHRG